jgi:hypothetical protein
MVFHVCGDAPSSGLGIVIPIIMKWGLNVSGVDTKDVLLPWYLAQRILKSQQHHLPVHFEIMAAIQKAVDSGAVPGHISNVCPPGAKAYLLEVGWLECDEGFVVRGGNTSLTSNEGRSFVNKRREMPMYCVLIDHPHEGCILWETGSGVDYPTVWGPEVSDVFTRVRYEPKHELKAAIEATGHKLDDIKKM